MPVHDAGDIACADLDPVRGTEQGKRRPALVLTSRRYNELSGRAVICPITSSAGEWPFNVPLPEGLRTHGVVLVDQVRAVDRASRVFRKIESAPAQLMSDVRAMLAVVLGIEPTALTGFRIDL
ncbi:MAG: type II toxin-antitoxin system PemK/MazF family toxin [Rhodopseudomonas palustris]|uniref:Type II toxin-antitoxin system PemK/MazF family toxin n=1 Tax=Rhodopseudomonas palustris TaxID=1076 RepID=A0A933VVS1_RHOPL|nr:type II toxin-antitoxin system PemK/MazF family toxin [Rhodopseudomonas palustris]